MVIFDDLESIRHRTLSSSIHFKLQHHTNNTSSNNDSYNTNFSMLSSHNSNSLDEGGPEINAENVRGGDDDLPKLRPVFWFDNKMALSMTATHEKRMEKLAGFGPRSRSLEG